MTKPWWAQLIVGQTPVSDPVIDERCDTRSDAEWRPLIKMRVLIMLGCLGAWAVSVEARLVWVQVVDHQAYVDEANKQHLDHENVDAPRGDILDRRGRLLAMSVRAFDLGADPRFVIDPDAEARELCQALGDCQSGEAGEISAKLRSPGKWVLIRRAREMSNDAVIGVQALIAQKATAFAKENKKNARLKGENKPAPKQVPLILQERSQRYYPQRETAAQVVGVISAEGDTGTGVEFRSNDDLMGLRGKRMVLRSGPGVEMFSRVERAPKPGASVELTLDMTIQDVAQSAIRQVVDETGALAATAIVLQVGTGDVLAMTSYPPYNPNNYSGASAEARRNRAVQDTYEPGSTFKIITLSAAINEGVLTPDSVLDCPGFLRLPGRSRPIGEAHGRNYGPLTLAEVLAKSSNVGAAKIGLQVGAQRMSQYARRFLLGQRVSPDLYGEESGRVEPLNRLTESALASMSIGYQVSVTPLQMATAASVFANAGMLVRPHIVRAVIRDGRREEVKPDVVHRVVSEETALTMIAMLEGVVQHGTGKGAALETYLVAGKTGTAQVARQGYTGDENNVSFVGFVPSRSPKFVIFVLVNSPRGGSTTGGAVAAPVFKRIALAALQYEGVQPSLNPAPPIMVAADRHPQPAPAVAVPAALTAGGRSVMPDLRGLTLRDALKVTQALGLEMSARDAGVVVSQSPAPGESIETVTRVVIQLGRTPAKVSGAGR